MSLGWLTQILELLQNKEQADELLDHVDQVMVYSALKVCFLIFQTNFCFQF